MKFSSSVLLSVLATLSSSALAAPTKQVPLKIDFSVERSSKAPKSGILARVAASGVALELENQYSMYIAEIELGTPVQKVRVDVDTGSSDLWVPGAGTSSSYGTYDNSKSSTYSKVKDGFSISYGDGSNAKGNWANETMTLGGVTVTDFMFGDATTQTAGEGVFGIGMIGNEASAWGSSGFTYDNFPVQLKNQGFINNIGYSLYLNSLSADSGSVLFGAIDKAKYSGDLKTLKLVSIDDSGSKVDSPVAFFVELDSITAGGKPLASKSYPALLDSGTTLIYAPSAIAEAIGSKYGEYSQSYGGYATSCSTKGDDFSFTFEDKTITVPWEDLLFKVDDSGKECLVGVLSSGSEYYILGDGFLRSSYIYYDLENNEVQIGQAKYTEDSDIQLV
ncbi:hypothetical protein DASC09_058290 [Saccharomycopsis crataegensis]|uniref:Peptidase A1 domain-containing protein n=1 Tax=Saccharomycopsis crataegensis TaxID=43959 RepID=A0AAV5QV67_9ASCO|nr:hypothetical protein DASC09_058290 [Saccharomycopsis crataegensis]